MRVVRAMRFGGPEVLAEGEAPDPVPGQGQVTVDVSVADTLFLDTVVRRGMNGPWSVRPPYVPGSAVAGTVGSLGARVDPGWVGRRVVAKPTTREPVSDTATVARTASQFPPTGGYAERAVAPARLLVPVPDGLALREAAALVNDGMTAILLADAVAVRPADRVLVTPAVGGVGSLLVQLAGGAGARVLAAARGRHKLNLARELGADTAVDYSSDDWPDRVREATGGAGADVVLDGVGGRIGRAAFELTARGGRFLAYGAPSGEFTGIDSYVAERHGVTASSILDLELTPADQQRLTERALAEAAAGRIRPVIGATFPLVRAADAHTAIETRGVTGKSLLMT